MFCFGKCCAEVSIALLLSAQTNDGVKCGRMAWMVCFRAAAHETSTTYEVLPALALLRGSPSCTTCIAVGSAAGKASC